MNLFLCAIVSFFAAVFGALGMGGGSILLLYLTLYAGIDQLAAQGINLLFFLPVAGVALILHIKNGLIRWRILLPCLILGFAGVYFGSKMAMLVGSDTLSRLFGGFLLLVGIRELTANPKKSRGTEKNK